MLFRSQCAGRNRHNEPGQIRHRTEERHFLCAEAALQFQITRQPGVEENPAIVVTGVTQTHAQDAAIFQQGEAVTLSNIESSINKIFFKKFKIDNV